MSSGRPQRARVDPGARGAILTNAGLGVSAWGGSERPLSHFPCALIAADPEVPASRPSGVRRPAGATFRIMVLFADAKERVEEIGKAMRRARGDHPGASARDASPWGANPADFPSMAGIADHMPMPETEADTCRKLVVPMLQQAGWDDSPHGIEGD